MRVAATCRQGMRQLIKVVRNFLVAIERRGDQIDFGVVFQAFRELVTLAFRELVALEQWRPPRVWPDGRLGRPETKCLGESAFQ